MSMKRTHQCPFSTGLLITENDPQRFNSKFESNSNSRPFSFRHKLREIMNCMTCQASNQITGLCLLARSEYVSSFFEGGEFFFFTVFI